MKKAFTSQQEYWQSWCTINYEQQSNINQTLKSQLVRIREKYEGQLEQLTAVVDQLNSESKTDFSGLMQIISKDCSSDMLLFAKNIITESMRLLTTRYTYSPCDFSALAIGSLAKGEATPYSDLEYLFLVREKTPENMEYFERLALTSYFLIGNLGETTLDYMDIQELSGWFKDCAKSGLKIDGLQKKAGNIPTGNGRRNTKNYFIVTLDELKGRYNHVLNNPDDKLALQGDLTSMLRISRMIFGHGDSAFKMYEEFLTFLSDCPVPEQRKAINLKMLKSDSAKFDFAPSDERVSDRGFIVDVKKELYRFPSIFVLDLSIVYNCSAADSWQTMDRLHIEGYIPDDLHQGLKFMLACACYIRLSAYLHLDSHDDNVSVAPISATIKPPPASKTTNKRWFTPINLFVLLSETSMPIKQQVSEMLENLPSDALPNLTSLQVEYHPGYKFIALRSAGRYFDALHMLDKLNSCTKRLDPETVTAHLHPVDQLLVLKAVRDVLYYCSKFGVSLLFAEHIHTLEQSDQSQIQLAKSHRIVGNYEKALNLLLTVTEDSADRYYQLAGVFYHLKNYKEAEHNSLWALQLFHNEASMERTYDYYGNIVPVTDECEETIKPDLIRCTPEERVKLVRNATPYIINSLRQLTNLHWKRSEYRAARLFSDKLDALLPLVYGDSALTCAAASIQNRRAINYAIADDHMQSEKLYKEALNTYREFHGSSNDHADIAKVLSNLGLHYVKSGDYSKGNDYSMRALEMYKRVYGECSGHESIIRTMHKLADGYRLQGNYTKAEEYFQTAVLQLRNHHAPLTDHRDIAEALSDLGHFYNQTKQYNQACDSLTEALGMCQRIYGTDGHHQDLADVLRDLGHHYSCLRDYETAIEYSHRALAMYREIYGEDGCHVDMCTALYNLGMNYDKIQRFEQAEKYSLKALVMLKTVFGDESNHINIAHAIKRLGCHYCHRSNFHKALEYFHSELNMYTSIHGKYGCTDDIGTALHNISVCYKHLGKYGNAQEYALQSLSMRRRIHGDNSNHIYIAHTLYSLAHIYAECGREDESAVLFKEALGMYNAVQPDHENVMVIENELNSTPQM
mgnify:CR=1 FL=1